MYKLIALDIDGTLLNSSGIITEKTIEYIKLCKKYNVIVTISTGRPIQGVKNFITELDLDAPIITYNGAMIVEAKSDEILFSQGLSGEDAKQIIELGLKKNVTMSIWSNNKLHVNHIDDNINNYKKLSGNEPIVLTDFDKVIKQGITKILWIDSADKVEIFNASIKDIMNKTITFCTSKPTFLEFFDSKVSKAIALEFISNKFNIDKSEMIAIGDGFNDLSMIEYVGMGVAMENAPDGVKEKANYITSSNDNDGIVNVIKKFILE